MSETAVAFARSCSCGIETAVAFAGAGRASTETVIAFARSCSRGVETSIAFAGAKWAFLVQFSGAEVMVVSCWPASAVAVVMAVSQLPRGCVLCAKKFSLRGLMVGVSAKKFALHAQNTPNSAILRLLGELFRGNAAGGAVLGEFFAIQQPWDPTGRTLSRRSPGSRPFYWEC